MSEQSKSGGMDFTTFLTLVREGMGAEGIVVREVDVRARYEHNETVDYVRAKFLAGQGYPGKAYFA